MDATMAVGDRGFRSIHVNGSTLIEHPTGIIRRSRQRIRGPSSWGYFLLPPPALARTEHMWGPALLLPHCGAAHPRPLRRHAAGKRRPGGVTCSAPPSPPPPPPSSKLVSRRAAAAGSLLVLHCYSTTNRALLLSPQPMLHVVCTCRLLVPFRSLTSGHLWFLLQVLMPVGPSTST